MTETTTGLVKKATLQASAAARARVEGEGSPANPSALKNLAAPGKPAAKTEQARFTAKPRQPKPAKAKAKAKAKKPVQPVKVKGPAFEKPYDVRHKRYWHQRLLLAALRERYPAAFPGRDDAPKPLKIGIYQDILAVRGELDPAFASRDRIRGFLRFYTCRWRYHEAVAAGVPRVDLAGNPVAQITERERARAAEQLARRAALYAAAAD